MSTESNCFNLLNTCCRTHSCQDMVCLHFTDEEISCDEILFKVQLGACISCCCNNSLKTGWLKTISICYCFQASESAMFLLVLTGHVLAVTCGLGNSPDFDLG